MPNIIDTLTVQLNLETSQYTQKLDQTQTQTKGHADKFESHFKGFQTIIGGLVSSLGRIVGAFLAVETVIKAINWTKGASEAEVSFRNLAEAIGISRTELSKWDIAWQKAGGKTGEIGSGMAQIQKELMASRGPQATLPSFMGPNNQWELVGLPSSNTYWNAKEGKYDIDRILKDADRLAREKHYSPAQRTALAEAFHLPGATGQHFLGGDTSVPEQLKVAAPYALTKEQGDAMDHVFSLWKDIGFAMSRVANEFVVRFEAPLKSFLGWIKQLLDDLAGKLKDPTKEWVNETGAGGGQQHTGSSSLILPEWADPLHWLGYKGRSRPPGERKPNTYRATPDTPSPVPDVLHLPPISSGGPAVPGFNTGGILSPSSVVRTPPHPTPAGAPYEGTPQAGPVAPSTDQLAPVTAPYHVVPGGAPYSGAPLPGPTATPPASGGMLQNLRDWWHGSDKPAGTEKPAGSELVKPQSRIDPSIFGLPQMAMAGDINMGAGSQSYMNNSKSNVAIANMNFHGQSGDTVLGHAPSGVDKDLGVAAHAVMADYSLA